MNKAIGSMSSRNSKKNRTAHLRLVERMRHKPVYVDKPQEDLFDERSSDEKKLVISNREFLRNYKALKQQLVNKRVDKIEILADEDHTFEIIMKKKVHKQTPFESLLEMIEAEPIKIQRPEVDLFDAI